MEGLKYYIIYTSYNRNYSRYAGMPLYFWWGIINTWTRLTKMSIYKVLHATLRCKFLNTRPKMSPSESSSQSENRCLANLFGLTILCLKEQFLSERWVNFSNRTASKMLSAMYMFFFNQKSFNLSKLFIILFYFI